jgi:hypothetical protein
MTTYNNIITKFNKFAEDHYQLHNFFSGKTWDFQANDQKFPAMIAFPSPSTIEPGLMKIKLNIFIADILNRSSTNLDEIYSDTLSIILDMFAHFRDDEDLNGFVISDNISVEPFEEKFDEILAGWSTTLEIEVEYDASKCGLPIKPIELEPELIDEAYVEDD